MARLLRIENCDECKHRGRFDDFCWRTEQELPEYSKPEIPDWCPLPEAEEVSDGAAES